MNEDQKPDINPGEDPDVPDQEKRHWETDRIGKRYILIKKHELNLPEDTDYITILEKFLDKEFGQTYTGPEKGSERIKKLRDIIQELFKRPKN